MTSQERVDKKTMKKSKQDLKTDDQKFIDWLKPSEKEFTVFDCKEYESAGGDWEGRVYDRQPDRIERFLMWLLKKYSGDAFRSNQYTFLDK